MDCEERDERGTYVGGYDLCENCFKKVCKRDMCYAPGAPLNKTDHVINKFKAKESQKQGQHVHPPEHEFIELTEPESGLSQYKTLSSFPSFLTNVIN